MCLVSAHLVFSNNSRGLFQAQFVIFPWFIACLFAGRNWAVGACRAPQETQSRCSGWGVSSPGCPVYCMQLIICAESPPTSPLFLWMACMVLTMHPVCLCLLHLFHGLLAVRFSTQSPVSRPNHLVFCCYPCSGSFPEAAAGEEQPWGPGGVQEAAQGEELKSQQGLDWWLMHFGCAQEFKRQMKVRN